MRAAQIAGCLAAALAPAAPAPAAQSAVSVDGRSLSLHSGERVVVRLQAGGVLALVSAVPAAASEAEPPKPRSPAKDDAGPAPGTIALTLGVEGARTLLKIDSGLSQAFDYRATLRRDGAAAGEAVGVCTVLPLLASWEHWPYGVRSLTLSGFATRPTNEVVCPEPPASQETSP
ncbi:hypothetical protein [Phenylobacterium sp.]|uniref:hypothetical protein n=1 Tax=Phenylobacterium sp. TaxID=1871053 RepID=UPI002F4057C2